ncbi:MAG TPA: TetR/AcrR family transcriptional regulator [Burkholderiaceae bacterium]|jgi:AcrR family transcriptional regulator|nr:TetR/AcrR family transcriptional regulator [Burkholderiaceae bacterium]
MTGKKLGHAPLKPRRKPVQSRSMATQAAILEAFVRLLQEKGYARLTIRDIAAVAGVGLGTVYEHFPSKQSIAANCIRQRFKSVGARMLACLDSARGRPLAESIDAVLDTLTALHADRPQEWSALIYLERQISDVEAYRSLYEHFVDIWQQILQASEAPPTLVLDGEAAYVLHAAVYGLLYQTLLCRPQMVGTPGFRAQLGALVHGYLHAIGSR